jgi:hypothetical protein
VQGVLGIGIQGLQGVQGVQGVAGIQGPSNGVTGAQGIQGVQGVLGIGIQGFQGVQGVQGVQGPAGPANGPAGVQGVQGPQGVYGVGIQGIQGPTGPQGRPAPNPSLVTLSTYSQTAITNNVFVGGTTTTIWTSFLPESVKGRSGILFFYFNIYSSQTAFLVSQSFDYGIYVDGIPVISGDTTTNRYVQAAVGAYAIGNGGVSLGVGGLTSAVPLQLPITIPQVSSAIQIGISNASSPITNGLSVNTVFVGVSASMLLL